MIGYAAIRERFQQHVAEAAPQYLVLLGALVGVVAVVLPAGFQGLDVTVTPTAGLVLALRTVTVTVPVIAFLTVLVIGGHDADTGIARERHLAGIPRAFDVLADSLFAIAVAVAFTAATGVAGVLAGLGDWARRTMLGPRAPAWHGDLPSFAQTTVLALGGVVLAVLLLVACSLSARRALAVTSAVFVSFAASLMVFTGRVGKVVLSVHPFGPAWSLLYTGGSDRLGLDIPGPAFWAINAAWFALLVTLALRRLHPNYRVLPQ